MARAVVLLSGGLDSSTVLYIAMDLGFKVHALSFRYGQKHTHELRAASMVAERAGVEEHLTAFLDPRLFRGSSLTGGGEVPDGRESPVGSGPIPSTYVPARNTVFLAMALAYAETIGSRDVFIGVNALDYSGYPDCRPEFIEAFQHMADLATRSAVEGGPIRIHAPLLSMTKAEIISRGLELGVDYSITHSCYSPDEAGRPCGMCDACVLRLRGFREAEVDDPASYSRGRSRDALQD
ncbi:MAG: 7-cyano-7-deazaguanine synthase QueC [Candidatus Fermentibacteraceae bacterium]|nr:7-cyano-7-deazaguanine synthase QueC [Candidatus Fermentibacteraceae bacterium]